MKLSPLIHEGDTYGQFVTMAPYLTNKQICDAKRLLRNSIEVNNVPVKDIIFVVNDEEGKIGWRAVAVDVREDARPLRKKVDSRGVA